MILRKLVNKTIPRVDDAARRDAGQKARQRFRRIGAPGARIAGNPEKLVKSRKPDLDGAKKLNNPNSGWIPEQQTPLSAGILRHDADAVRTVNNGPNSGIAV